MPKLFGPDKTVNVLAVGDSAEYQSSLLDILSRSNWKFHFASSLREALPILKRDQISVVLCEHKLRDARWLDVLREVERLDHCPRLIVAATNADESLWAEVLNLGGYDVLEMPFDPQEVVRVLSLAWLQWRKQPARPTMALTAMATA